MKVCVNCQIELRPATNGVVAISMASFGECEMYEADLWMCPSCGWKGMLGFASEPFARHHDPDFAKRLADAERDRVCIRYWLNGKEKMAPTEKALDSPE